MDRNILFLCTGNSARSQIGEALLRKHAGDRFQVFSAGTKPKGIVFPPVIEAMREIGIDLSDRTPKGVEEYLGKVHFERVIVVCAEAEKQCPTIFGSAAREFWPLTDPAAVVGCEEEVLAVCREVRDQIDRRICRWLDEQGIAE